MHNDWQVGDIGAGTAIRVMPARAGCGCAHGVTGSVIRLNSALPYLGRLFESAVGDEKVLLRFCLHGVVRKSASSVSSEQGEGTSSQMGMGALMAVYMESSARMLFESEMDMGVG